MSVKQEWGEPGSIDYWIEAMKRAYQMGEERALPEIDRLLSITGPHPPFDFTGLPEWFYPLWRDHIAPYASSKYAMPY